MAHQYCPACGFPIGTLGSSTDKFVGKTLPGGYAILDLISVGGMGRVYRAQQSALGRTVAVKIIHPHLLSDENSALRFMTEARAASQLNHPNSVSVFDFGRTEDGQPYLVMEFLRGKDLARVAYEEGPLPFSRIVDVLCQVLAALGEAHELGIVHRDLKPENVILEPLKRGGDFVKVVDFGLAKLKADAQAPSNVTAAGIVCGTPDYMAPEQGRGDAIDGRSDLYSVGVMFFQLLTGRLPFEAESPTQVVMMHMTIPVPDPRQVAPERSIPDPLVEVVFRALAKDPRDRYHDAQALGEALRSALTQADSVPPEQRLSFVPGGVMACPACGLIVATTKFCGECGTRLPMRSGAPDSPQGVSFPLSLAAREEDLAWLEDRRRSLHKGLVSARIVGEPGVGKTRLVQEFLSSCRSRGDLVVSVGPDPFFADVQHFALRQALLGLSGLRPEEVAARRFDGATPLAERGLIDVFSDGPSGERVGPLDRRLQRAQALRWALARAQARAASGVVLAIDELQRVDEPSRTAFADLVGEPPEGPALVIAAHTPGFEAGWSAEGAARVLAGLPPAVVSRLLKLSPSGEKIQLDDVGPRGQLPMYIEQVLRYAVDGAADPPRRLADLIALRVDTLGPNARRALQALATLGDGVERSLISELLPNVERLSDAIDELSRAGMVVAVEDRVATSHPLLREIVLAGIPAAVRRELHRKALAVGDKLHAPLEARAQHAYYAGDSFQALLLLEQVADRAAARGDTAGEILALRRGLEIARQEISRGELDDPLRAVLIFSRKLGACLARSGSYGDAEGVLREALDLAGPSGSERARVLQALAQVAHGRQRGKEAVGYIDQAIEAAKQSGAHDLASSLADTRRAWIAPQA
jgi:serine/threonine protein kinase